MILVCFDDDNYVAIKRELESTAEPLPCHARSIPGLILELAMIVAGVFSGLMAPSHTR